MTPPIDLRPDHAKIVHDIIARRLRGGVSVRVFGSRAKWTAKPHSDLDLAFKGKGALPRAVLSDLSEAFSESDLPFRVDVVDWHSVAPSFQAVIDRDGVALPWPQRTIGNFVKAGEVSLQTGPFGSQLHSYDYLPDGVPVIPTEGIKDRRIDHSVLPKISVAKANELVRHQVKEGDILFARRGVQATGHTAMIRTSEIGFLCGTGVIRLRIRADSLSLFPPFLAQLLSLDSSVDWFKFHAIGATMPNLNEGIISAFSFPVPPIGEQQAIASVLAALDDKVELNWRMNATLERQAQAIFRDWFVDFGPVRRKQAGEVDPVAIMSGLTPDPTHATHLAALFPDAFGDDGLPVGWSRQTVESIMALAYGKSLPKTVRKDGPFPVYGSGGISGTHSTALVSGPGIIVGRKGTVGSLYWEAGDFFAIDTVFYVIPKDGVPLNFAWHLLKTLGLEGMNTDAAVPGLNRGNAYRLEFAFGGAMLMEAFETFAGPMRARQDASNSETQTLAETRDYLLPRLMSGTVRVVSQDRAA